MSPSINNLKTLCTKFEAKLEKTKSRMRKSNLSHKQNTTSTEPKAVVEEHNVVECTKPVENETHLKLQSTSTTAIEQQQKSARREARKMKWAGRRATFKAKAKKAAKSLVKPCLVVLEIIFGPVLVAIDLVIFIVSLVLGLVLEVLKIICLPLCICLW